MPRTVTVACLQTVPRAAFEEATAEALKFAEQAVAEGAQLLALPEYCGGLKSEAGALAPPAAPEAEHPVLAALRRYAAEAKVWMHVGSIAVAAPDGRTLNRGFVLDDAGAIRARYDKIHMFDVELSSMESYRESDVIAPGAEAVVAETPWMRLGMSICYDLRFAALYRDLAQSGAEVLTCPAAFVKTTGQAHWHVLNRARAIENGSFMVSPCAVGTVPGGGECYGHSLIVDPWGVVLADGGDEPGVIMAELDLDAIAATRRRVPSLSHDRPFRSAADMPRASDAA